MNEEELVDTVIDLGEDLADIREPDPLPEGTYKATIEKVEKKVSKTGNAYINVRLSVGTDQYPVDYVNDMSTSLFYMVSLSDNHYSQLGLKKFCEATGLPLRGKINFADAIKSEVNIKVKQEEYEGVIRSVIKSVEKV